MWSDDGGCYPSFAKHLPPNPNLPSTFLLPSFACSAPPPHDVFSSVNWKIFYNNSSSCGISMVLLFCFFSLFYFFVLSINVRRPCHCSLNSDGSAFWVLKLDSCFCCRPASHHQNIFHNPPAVFPILLAFEDALRESVWSQSPCGATLS